MRTITVKYSGDCQKCGATIPVGDQAIYERRVGIFCPSCGPTDPEDVREYRQQAADRRADKYEEWAEKREATAKAQLNSHPQIRRDWAFITQPGHIHLRARMNRADDRAYESLDKAAGFRDKAKRLRKVRVKGDAEAARQVKREAVLAWLKVGQRVHTGIYGIGVVEKINRKTATIAETGQSSTFKVNVDLSWLRSV